MSAVELECGSVIQRGPHNFISPGEPKGHNPALTLNFIITYHFVHIVVDNLMHLHNFLDDIKLLLFCTKLSHCPLTHLGHCYSVL